MKSMILRLGFPRRCLAISGVVLFTAVLAASLPAQSIRFAVVADPHVGSDHAAAGLREIVESINAQAGLRFVVLDGDITEKGGDDEFREAKSILAGLNRPCHVLAGNHDLHWMGYGGEGFRQALGDGRFAFQEGGAAFLGLSAGDLGHFAPEDLDWLAEAVHKLPPDADIFFFVHFPPSMLDNWDRARELLRSHRTIVISGHVHADQKLEAGGMPVFTVRSALAGSGFPGFDVVEITPDAVTVETVVSGKPAPAWGGIPKNEWTTAPAVAPSPLPSLPARILWRQERRTRLLAAPVTDGKNIFIADLAGRIACIDAQGAPRWTYEGKAAFISRPVVYKKQLFAASVDGRMIKLDAGSGRLLASAEFGVRFTSQLVAYEDPQVKVPRLLAGTAAGRLLCVNLFNLTDVWTSDAAKGAIQSRPLIAAGKAVFGAWDGSAHAVDIETGRELWRWTENDNFYYSPAGCVPALSDGRVLFCCPDGFVSAVDLKSGQTLWRVDAGSWESLGLSADGKKVLVKGRQGAFSILDIGSGAVLKKIAPAHGGGDVFPSEPLDDGGRILYGAQNGRIYEINAAGAVRPILDLGPGGIHTFVPLGGGRYLAANVDGLVVAFERPK